MLSVREVFSRYSSFPGPATKGGSLLIAIILLVLICFVTGCSDEAAESAGGMTGSAAENGASDERASPFATLQPPLACNPSDADGRGTVAVDPAGPVEILSRRTWTITWTAVDPGVAPGGFVILQVSPWWGWSTAQSKNDNLPGYVDVATVPPDRPIEVETLGLNRIAVRAGDGGLRPGDELRFVYHNAVADKFAEREELFQVLVDADGDGHYATVPDSPRITLLPRAAERLEVNAPCQARPGETIEISIACVDRLGNWALFPADDAFRVRVICNDGTERETAFPEPDPIVAEPVARRLSITLPDKEGVYFFEVNALASRFLQAKSNPLLCRKGERKLNLYFGDIHGHTRLSDGTGTPEDYYAFARNVSGLDIAALTDHDSYGTFPIDGTPWERIKRAARDAHAPGSFVTFLGYEWTNWESGHRNVYYRESDRPIFNCLDDESSTPTALWDRLEPYEAMTIAHHTGGGPVPIDWSYAPGDREWLVEIYSVHGSSESYRGASCIYRPVKGAFVFDALNRGYKLGIIGSGDTHDGHPGQRTVGAPTGGLFGLFAPELTRHAVWDAFKKRHVYGTSGEKIILFSRTADAPMGSEVVWTDKSVPVVVHAVGTDAIEAVEVIRNGAVCFRHECDGLEVVLLVEDPDPPVGTSWYMTKVTQENGSMAWSSPVWVTRQ